MSHNYRLKLRASIKILLWIAFGFVGYVFVKGMFSTGSETNTVPTQVVEVAHWQPGDTQLLNWSGRPIVIHRRTPAELAALKQADPGLTVPETSNALQNTKADPTTRSVSPNWFVAIALGTDYVCAVEYLPPSGDLFQGTIWAGGYQDSCDGSRFDAAGRAFQDQAADENMIIPQYVVRDLSIILGAQ